MCPPIIHLRTVVIRRISTWYQNLRVLSAHPFGLAPERHRCDSLSCCDGARPVAEPGVSAAGCAPGWPISIFFEIRFKIKWLEKECIFQNFDQNKVRFNRNLDRNQAHFNRVNQKQVPPQVPRAWQGGQDDCAGRGTTGVPPSASESSAGEVVALGLNRSF